MLKKLFGGFILTTFLLSGCSNDVGPAEDIKIEQTPERIARGKYLANNVSMCIDCHSKRDFTLLNMPKIDGTEGQGGELFGKEAGFPGNIYAPNITPYALGSWTDGEIVRAVASGVNKHGKSLFPVMPYLNMGKISQEDVYSIVAYIKTLKPIKNDIPERTLDFPMNLIVNTIPKKAEFSTMPDKKNVVEYGKYMTTAASCFECHTQMNKGKPLEGMDFAGGAEFKIPTGTVRSANITPDMNTGIGKWSKDDFIKKFKHNEKPESKNIKVKDKEFNSIMPWTFYSGMTEEDLGAIYEYLKTAKPVENKVEKFVSAG